MAIYVDELIDYGAPGWKAGEWCHMWSSDGDFEALDRFAESIGLKREWCQISAGHFHDFYHYDLRPGKRKQAIAKGAVEYPLQQWIKETLEREKAADAARRTIS